ncbi:MAG TPA: universal stress protein [Chthoniobacteraceae bacterium]|jgi:nucleotide-binding universal stress UspA family protein|nr:universal stress protein [Chthoniobacteraceae bacterium]
MKTILVPVDYSDATEKVIEAACALARAFDGRIILVHIVEPAPQVVGYDPGPLSVPVEMPPPTPADPERLESLKRRCGAKDVLALEVRGSAPEEVLKLAREHGAEVIVMGSHGHGAIYQLLVGGVADAVLKAAPCPVLIVPSGRAVSK